MKSRSLTTDWTPPRLMTPLGGALLQRKCACGGTPGPTGECEACRRKRLQRKTGNAELAPRGDSSVPPVVHEVLRSAGQPLDQTTRSFMEPRFGQDFSQVRVHTGTRAAQSAQAVNALAYTVGHHVVFEAGQYAPCTRAGRYLLAHELTHVIQQQQGGFGIPQELSSKISDDFAERDADRTASRIAHGGTGRTDHGQRSVRLQRRPRGGEDPIHRPLIEQFRREQGLPPEGVDPSTRQRVGPSDAQIKYQLLPDWLAAQPPARFIRPVPRPEDPLGRLLAGRPPGLTTMTINGARVASLQDVQNAIVPTNVTPISSAGGAAGGVACQVPRNFEFSVSAEMIVATDAAATGWTATAPPVLGGNRPPQCAGRPQARITMNALPSNADFTRRVRDSEQEHVDAIQTLHNRHLVPYAQFLMGLQGHGPDLSGCAQNIATQMTPRAIQAAYGFIFGYQAETARLDDPGGTHIDSAAVQADQSCNSVTITLSGHPRIPGSEPGNVVPVAPTVTRFNPNNLRVNGTAIQDGNTAVKTFSTPLNAQRALQVIQHYGMTSRNVIGPMEFFLVGAAAPTGQLAGANELAINPAYYQVSRSIPTMPNDWVIAEVAGTNVLTLVNFGANRDAAYSAYNVMRQFRFTNLCWVGGTRQSPEMRYFRV